MHEVNRKKIVQEKRAAWQRDHPELAVGKKGIALIRAKQAAAKEAALMEAMKHDNEKNLNRDSE